MDKGPVVEENRPLEKYLLRLECPSHHEEAGVMWESEKRPKIDLEELIKGDLS